MKELDNSILNIIAGFPLATQERTHSLSNMVMDPGQVVFKQGIQTLAVTRVPLRQILVSLRISHGHNRLHFRRFCFTRQAIAYSILTYMTAHFEDYQKKTDKRRI